MGQDRAQEQRSAHPTSSGDAAKGGDDTISKAAAKAASEADALMGPAYELDISDWVSACGSVGKYAGGALSREYQRHPHIFMKECHNVMDQAVHSTLESYQADPAKLERAVTAALPAP